MKYKPKYNDKGVEGLRLARPSDEDQLYHLLMMLHAENGIFKVNPRKVRDGIQVGTLGQGGLIYVNDGLEVVATLGMVFASDWYTDDVYLSERWNYVHPDHRRSDYANMLLEQAKWSSDYLSRGKEKVPLQVGICSNRRTEAKVRFYARQLPCIGAFFMYGKCPQPDFEHELREKIVEVEKVGRKARCDRSREVAPLVETVIKVSGRDNVQQR